MRFKLRVVFPRAGRQPAARRGGIPPWIDRFRV